MKGDFLGFSFDGTHCSTLGITHVSSSDRYSEELFPEVKDKTVEIPGNHGEFYYGSTYGTRTFEIEFAYDSITEKQFRSIRRLFGTTKVCELIFDERPYKVYYAKIESPLEMSYVCFDEQKYDWVDHFEEDKYIPNSKDHKVYSNETQRIYKGEGTINLICYFPFARQLFKTLNLYREAGSHNLVTTYSNVSEWSESSGILEEEVYDDYKIDQVISIDSPYYRYAIPVYNPGDLDVGFCLYIPFQAFTETINEVDVTTYKICPDTDKNVIIINGDSGSLCLNTIVRKNALETGIIINTTNHLIEGVRLTQVTDLKDKRTPTWTTMGTIYNEYIVAGDFPYIKRHDIFDDTTNWPTSVNISCNEVSNIGIYYNYLYF